MMTWMTQPTSMRNETVTMMVNMEFLWGCDECRHQNHDVAADDEHEESGPATQTLVLA